MDNTCLGWLGKVVEYCEAASLAFREGKRSHCRQNIRAAIHALSEANWAADLNALVAEDPAPLPLEGVAPPPEAHAVKRKRRAQGETPSPE